LQGTYDLATLTPVERPAGSPLVMSDEDGLKLERQAAARRDQLGAPIDGNRAAPPVGGDGSAGPAGNVGGYNNFWIDAGSRYTVIDGQRRASLLIDPPDGRVPQMTPQARQRFARNIRPTSDQSAREDDPGFEGGGAYDDPSVVRLASAASWASARRQGHRSCRTTSTTTFIRSCRRRILC
jgi:hypothetical protein